jgi:glutamate-1-semialdehyde 2,1-aminomutase
MPRILIVEDKDSLRSMLEAGFLLAPSQFEATFVGLAHTDEDIDRAIAAAEGALKTL